MEQLQGPSQTLTIKEIKQQEEDNYIMGMENKGSNDTREIIHTHIGKPLPNTSGTITIMQEDSHPSQAKLQKKRNHDTG